MRWNSSLNLSRFPFYFITFQHNCCAINFGCTDFFNLYLVQILLGYTLTSGKTEQTWRCINRS